MTIKIFETVESNQESPLVMPALTGEQATWKANGYLTMHVGMFCGTANPVLLPLEHFAEIAVEKWYVAPSGD